MLAADDGRLPDAEAELSRIVERLHGIATPIAQRLLGETLVDRALVRQLSNRWSEALADLDRALAVAQPLPLLLKRSVASSALARRVKLLARVGTPVRDLAAARRDADAARALGGLGWLADELDCTVAQEQGDWRRVAQLSPQLGARYAAEGFAVGAAFSAVRSATASVELGQYGEAESALQAALPLLERDGPPDQLARALLLRARCDSAAGRHEPAWSAAQRALAVSESLIRQFRVLAEQHRFVSDKQRNYTQAFAIALAGDGPQRLTRACSVAERAKGFYLCQLMANADIGLFEGVPASLRSSLQQLDDAIDAVERRLASAQSPAAGEALAGELQGLLAQHDAALAEAMRCNPRWAALRTPPPIDLDALLTGLERPGNAYALWSLFVVFDACGAVVHSFFGSRGRLEHAAVRLTPAELDEVQQCREALEGFDATDLDLPVLPQAVCAPLLPPSMQSQLAQDRSLLVSAHGPLAGLAWQALQLDDGRRLIEHCPVLIVPSFALLLLPPPPRESAPAQRTLLVGCTQDDFGSEPLPEVEHELDALADLWLRQGAEVRSEHLQAHEHPQARGCAAADWQHAAVVHVACHGRFDPARPFDAALLLGTDLLRATDFFSVRLATQAVILSACDLGRRADALDGVATAFDEWLGLALPLFYAGARTLVASRWPAASNPTLEFMRALHGALAEGQAPAAAYRRASLALLDGPEPWQDVLWANWMLAGIPQLAD